MKALPLALVGSILLLGHGHAQIVVPANPGKFAPRPIGGGVSPGVEVIPKQPVKPTARYVTHIVLSETRIWSSSDGRTLQGKLIAFEDLIAETPKGSTEPAIPPRPVKPTVIRTGKARLMVNNKTFEIELGKLSQADQDFISQIETGITKQAAAKPTP
jgi:hypothetical protein